VSEQRATLGQGLCSRPGCGRVFEPRRSGGSPQEFCSPACRQRFNDESRRATRARAKREAVARRGRTLGYWGSGIDMSTGKRVPVAVKTPQELLP
jgi:hypothetical protein